MSDSVGIKRYGIEGLRSLFASWGEPGFRSDQLVEWMYSKAVSEYADMSNLSKGLRERLQREQPITSPTVVERRISSDGTRKYLLKLADGCYVETVGIPDDARLTVCFSTQVGCGMGCVFCETGTRGLTRSLWPGEMVDQLMVVAADMNTRVTNAVAMGEGEPFANYTSTLDALRIMNSPRGLGIGARHLTVSSCGLLSPLARFATEPEQFTLAISLHSAIQSTRDRLMPSLKGHPLSELRLALVDYAARTGRRPSLEVTLIEGVNDTDAEVEALVGFAGGLLCHINLIRLNTRSDNGMVMKPSSVERCKVIATRLEKAGVEFSVRRPRGTDIDAACGQLKGSVG